MARIQTTHRQSGDLFSATMYNEIIDSVNALYDRQESFKGAYASASDLSQVEGAEGDLALVLNNGAFPASIYRHNGTAWASTGKTWTPSETIDLAAYAKSIDIAFLVCDTAAATAAKTVSASGYSIKTGGNIRIKMTYANTADNATLNINSTGNVPLYYDGARASATNSWEAGETILVYYDVTTECFMACDAQGGGGKFVNGQSVKGTGFDERPTKDSTNLLNSGTVYVLKESVDMMVLPQETQPYNTSTINSDGSGWSISTTGEIIVATSSASSNYVKYFLAPFTKGTRFIIDRQPASGKAPSIRIGMYASDPEDYRDEHGTIVGIMLTGYHEKVFTNTDHVTEYVAPIDGWLFIRFYTSSGYWIDSSGFKIKMYRPEALREEIEALKGKDTELESGIDGVRKYVDSKVDDYDGSLDVDPTVVPGTGVSVTITNGIANRLISANGGSGNRGFWNSFTNGRAWIYDVTSEVGKSINITYWNRANTRRYIFVPDISLLKSSDPGAELWPTMYISLGAKASSTTSYTPLTATGVTVPQPVTAAGDPCEKVYLIVSGYYVSADSESNIIPKVVVPENAYVIIPKKTSQLTNDSGFITEASLQNDDGDLTPVYTRSSGVSANGANNYKGYWRNWNYPAISSASNVAKSNVFDVTEKVGKKLSIVAWRRANARIYAFVTDYTLITTSVPSDEDWADMFISGARSTSTVSDPYYVQITVPEPKTEGGSVYLIVTGLYVDATSKYNITARAIDPDDAEVIIPRKTSQLENDSGFITTEQGTGIMALNPKKDYLLRVKNMVHHFYNGTHQVTPLLLAHFSDIHGNGTAVARMLEWCGEFGSYIDDIIHTGDCVTEKYSDGLGFWDNVEGSERILNITGNHDYSTTGDGSGGKSAADVYQLLFVGGDSENPRIANWGVVEPENAGAIDFNAWYKDYTSKKVRLIGLDCMKRNSSQLAWFKTVLADAANNSLTVVIGFHSSPQSSNYELVECPFTGMYNGSIGAYNWASAVMAVDDFKAGTLEGQERAGDFACWLGGHSHKDTVVWVNGSQLAIVVDSMTTGISGRNRLVSTDDKSRDCFNLVAIDTYWKTVKLLRVGNDTDDQLRKINQCSIKYTTGKVDGETILGALREEVANLQSKSIERMSLDEFNAKCADILEAGKVFMLSSSDNNVYDSYIMSDGTSYLSRREFKFIGKGVKETVVGTYSKYATYKGKGNYITTSGVIYQGTTNGTDVRVRIFDVSEYNGRFMKLMFHAYGTALTTANVGWSFFKKVYVADEETGEPTEVLVPAADYDFTDAENVVKHGVVPSVKTLLYSYVVCPDDAYLLACTFYNNNNNVNGQKCGFSLIDPVEYAAEDAIEPLVQLPEVFSAFLDGKDYLSDNLVSVGRTAKKYIIKETGALYSGSYGATGRFYVSNYIDVASISDLSYKIKFYCKQNVAVIAAYDAEYTYILENSVTLDLKSSAKTATGLWERGENTRYIRIAVDLNYSGSYVVVNKTFASLENRVSALENAEDILPAVVERNEEAGQVLTQMRYRGNPAPSQGGQNTTSTTVFIHFSDIHGATSNMKNIVTFFDYYAAFIDDIVNTGDTVANSFPNGTVQTVAEAGKVLTAIGNHDTATYSGGSYNWTANVGVNAYNKFIKPYMFATEDDEVVNQWGVTQPEGAEENGYCFYYKDYASGVRLIVLDSMDAREYQTTWLASVLASARTGGKTVVCATHCVSGEITVIPCGMSYSQTTTGNSYGGVSQVSHLIAVQDFIDGGGKFACWLEGHAHTDAVGYLTEYPKQLVVRVAMAAYNNTQTAVTRLSSGISFDDFNIVCIDPANKWVQLCKVGAQFSRNLMRREPATIDYVNMKAVWPKVYSMISDDIDEGDTDDN